MNEYLMDIERGKKILRSEHINMTMFKTILSNILENTHQLDEDDWVMHYNTYAGCVGRTGYEPLPDWAAEFFQDFNEKEHRIYLSKH